MSAADINRLLAFKDLADRLDSAPHGQRGTIVEQASRRFGHSGDWVYKQLRKMAGWSSGRKRRNDHGTSCVSQEDAFEVGNILRQSKRDTGKQLLGTATARDIAASNNRITATSVSPTTLLRAMNKHGVHPEQLDRAAPHANLRSLHPNHVWQFDVSVCVLFYLQRKKGLQVMPQGEFYKNKPANLERIVNERVLRYLVTDHCSGVFYLEYFLAPGERADTLFLFLLNAFHKRPNDPFHGLPGILLWDAGTANTSHMVQHFVERLGIRCITHEPGNPRAKGQVETTHNIVERDFEGRLAFWRVDSPEQLNEKARLWSLHYCATKRHSRHGRTRFAMWQTLTEEQLVLAPPRRMCEAVLQQTKPDTRTVGGDFCISFKPKGYERQDYRLESILDVRVGDKVEVYVNPFRAPNIDVVRHDAEGNEYAFEIPPVGKDANGFHQDAPVIGETFRAPRDSDTDRARKAMDKAAYGAETSLEVEKARKQRLPAFGGEIDPFKDLELPEALAFLPKKGMQREMKAPRIEVPTLPWVRAGLLVKDTLGLEPHQMPPIRERFAARYPNGIPEDQLANFLQEVTNGGTTAEEQTG